MKKYVKPDAEILSIDVRCENILVVSYQNYDEDWGVQDGFID